MTYKSEGQTLLFEFTDLNYPLAVPVNYDNQKVEAVKKIENTDFRKNKKISK